MPLNAFSLCLFSQISHGNGRYFLLPSAARVVEVRQFLPAVTERKWLRLCRRQQLTALVAHRDKQAAMWVVQATRWSVWRCDKVTAGRQRSRRHKVFRLAKTILAAGYQEHLLADGEQSFTEICHKFTAVGGLS